MKTIKFYTLGCKVNQYETQAMREEALRLGFREAGHHTKAGVYIINTCTVTQRADSESMNLIRRARRENPRARIVVTGCLAELDRDKISGVAPGLKIAKNRQKPRIFELYNGAGVGTHRAKSGITGFEGHTRAFLKIQDGCNNCCSYCKVPLVRGRSKSRPRKEILREAKNLVNNGFKEIVLTGICLGSYGKDLKHKDSLVGVITELENIEGLLRIRLSSIEADDVTGELLELMKGSRIVCPHLHIPLQSGDDHILKMMNRRYSRGQYLDLIHKIKAGIPGIAITTDCLVGFPGESEANFRNTLEAVQEIAPLKVHVFPYSRRPGTQAGDNLLLTEISLVEKKERIARLRKVAQASALSFMRQFLYRALEVLVEGPAKGCPGCWEGFTGNYIKVRFASAQNCANKLAPVSLEQIGEKAVDAKIC